MRDFASCFSEHAVKVSDTSCSGSSSSGKSSVVAVDQSVQTVITSLYRTRLATHKDVLVKVTWSKTPMGPVLSLGVDDDPKHHQWNPNMTSHILRKRKGTRSFVSRSSVVGLYWDYSAAKINSGPEPVSNFYVIVVVDAELVLLLGDLSGEFIKKFDESIPIAEFSLVSRREQVLGQSVYYSTRARFGDGGKDHDIVIRCKGDGWDSKESELVVSLDKKRVVQVKRLQWNFRGNQTIFIDGVPVDMMWDVGNWWCSSSSPPGNAVFMFRQRSTLQSRLWLEEEMLHKERGISGFSLLIQAFKNA